MNKHSVPGLCILMLATSLAFGADETAAKESERKMAAAESSQSAGSKAVHDAMMKGMKDMHGMKMTGDADHDFAKMMIHHHQQAIDMSRAQLKHGSDAEVKKKAQEIIAASEKDIAELKKWQSQHHAATH